jgi:hypothetical protein
MSVDTATLARLAPGFTGRLLQPADAEYEDARRLHNGLVDKRPALIARCPGRRTHQRARWIRREARRHRGRALRIPSRRRSRAPGLTQGRAELLEVPVSHRPQ